MLAWFILKEVFAYLEHHQQVELRLACREWNRLLEEMIECDGDNRHMPHVAKYVRQGRVTHGRSRVQLWQFPNVLSVSVSVPSTDSLAEVMAHVTVLPKLRHMTVFESQAALSVLPAGWLSSPQLQSLDLILLGQHEQLAFLSGIACPNLRTLHVRFATPSQELPGLLAERFRHLVSVKLNYEGNAFLDAFTLVPPIASLRDATITVYAAYPRHRLPSPELIPNLASLAYSTTGGPLEFVRTGQVWPQISRLVLTTPAYRLGPIRQLFPNCTALVLHPNHPRADYLDQLQGVATLALLHLPTSLAASACLPSITSLRIALPFLAWANACLPNLAHLDLSLGYGGSAEEPFYACRPFPSLTRFFSPEERSVAFYSALIARCPKLASVFASLPDEHLSLLEARHPAITFLPYIRLISEKMVF